MKIVRQLLPGAFVFEPDKYRDNRGVLEVPLHQEQLYKAVGDRFRVDQTMWAVSHKNVIRGLHYQAKSTPVAKIVTCTIGTVYDVIVDLRQHSETYGRWAAYELVDIPSQLIYIPAGFAHGYLSLSEFSGLFYYQQGFYDPDQSLVLSWDDPDIGIVWPLAGQKPVLSDRDKAGLSWAEYAKNPEF